MRNVNAMDSAYGAAGDGVVDDAPALAAAVAAAGAGGVVTLPPGTYRLASSLVLSTPVILQGSGGAGDSASTVLQAAPGVPALVVARGTPGGDWARIHDVALRASGKAGGAHGVVLHARAALHDCNVQGFGGHGVLVDSAVAGANCNGWAVHGTRITGCDGAGLRVTGADSNAGLVTGLDSTGNGGWGVEDTSLTGNTYLACHAAANVAGAYRSANSGQGCMFLNCYREGDQPANQILSPAIVIGGVGMGASDAWLQMSRTSASGLRLGGGGSVGGALVETPVLLALGANTAPIAPSCSYLVPYIAADTEVTALPGIAPGLEGQRITIRNNTLVRFTLHDMGSVPGSGFGLATPYVTLAPRDVLHLICWGGCWYEEGRVVR